MPVKTAAKQEDGYFTPDIEDLRVGYECEVAYNMGDIWKTIVLDRDSLNEYLDEDIFRNEIRVPYLTKEQIEAEGWIIINENNPTYYRKKLEDHLPYDYQWIIIDFENHYVNFLQSDTHYDGSKFCGECKDINTFRYICKLLNIK